MAGIVQNLPFESTLPSFGPPFMAHVPIGKIDQIIALTASDAVGAVVVTQSDNAARSAVRKIRNAKPAASILIDKNRYSTRRRQIGAANMSTDWINLQLQTLNLPWALTDSGYVPAGDSEALKAVLSWGQMHERIIVTLPLALEWLRDDVDQLIDQIAAAGCPVAITLEHKRDPLSTRAAVRGLIKVLRALDNVLLLRCDASTLGALAYGAPAVSVGVETGLRHLYPITDPKEEETEFRRGKQTSLFIPKLLTYKMINQNLLLAMNAQPDLDVWKCDCSQCLGRSLMWITTAGGGLDTAAFQHSLCALTDLARQLLALPATERPGWWKDECALAQPRYSRIQNQSGKSWEPPGALKAWVASTPTPQELRS